MVQKLRQLLQEKITMVLLGKMVVGSLMVIQMLIPQMSKVRLSFRQADSLSVKVREVLSTLKTGMNLQKSSRTITRVKATGLAKLQPSLMQISKLKTMQKKQLKPNQTSLKKRGLLQRSKPLGTFTKQVTNQNQLPKL